MVLNMMSGGEKLLDYLPNPTDYHDEELTVHSMWCPYCGGWHGAGVPPPRSDNQPQKEAPPVPEVIGKIVQKIMKSETNVSLKPPPERWPEVGSIDGQPAQIKRDGDRMRVIWDDMPGPTADPYNHREIITNDGLNADYVRDLNEEVIVNRNADNPYEPYIRDTSNRYTFE